MTEATKRLPPKHQAFIDSFFLHNQNATEAYLDVYGVEDRHVAQVAGSRLLSKVVISEEIKRRRKEISMSADEVIARLSDEARGDMGDFMDIQRLSAQINLFKAKGLGLTHLIRKVKQKTTTIITKNGDEIETHQIEIELHDPQAAKALLARYHGLLADRDDRSGIDGENNKPISISIDMLAPSFIPVYFDARDRKHMEYLLKGGRGSTKSSFASMAMICLLVNNPGVHGLAMRQVANTLRDSVYSQLVWAIGMFGLEDKFKCSTSPLEITYVPSGQKIYFRGADKPEMIKSIKPTFGHIGILWFEELDQFHGPEAIRKIEQSTLRGGEEAWEFKTYNPPRTAANWVNKYALIPKANQYQHHSTYLDVPAEWLGQTFIDEAEHLKAVNPTAYEHEYLGIVVGTGGMVFENVQLRAISDEEISQFDRVTYGGDWGFYPDPADFGPVHYDAARRVLYIFAEHRVWKQTNLPLYDGMMRALHPPVESMMILDSASPKDVADFRQYASDGIPMIGDDDVPVLDARGKPVLIFGPSCRGAEKGPDSVKYSIKWLQGLTAIVIDNQRCPYAAEEFIDYEYEQDPDGNFISEYPDKNNHAIDRVRYATNLIWRKRGQ